MKRLPELDPDVDSEDSGSEPDLTANTIGSLPISAYDNYPHIGYDIDGRRIMRPATSSALDALLDQIELPEGYTGLLDPQTGAPLTLSRDELELLQKLQSNAPPTTENIYADTIEFFTHEKELMPLSAAPEPKRRFVPSKHEAKRVMKLVRAIRAGRIVPNPPKVDPDEDQTPLYDVWAEETPADFGVMHMPAPKLPPPTHELSYNPPPEYDVPRYGALRKVPAYADGVKERFERCLDLYLAPRALKQKLNIDPESLLPKLPSPQDLRPFPCHLSLTYIPDTQTRIRSVAIDNRGIWLAAGCDDGLRVFELSTGRQVRKYAYSDPVDALQWNPVRPILALASGNSVYIVAPDICTKESVIANPKSASAEPSNDTPITDWVIEDQTVEIRTKLQVRQVDWHRKGDYLLSSSSNQSGQAVLIHQLSAQSSQAPFRRSRGLVQDAHFHPSAPVIFVMTQRYIRVYDLASGILTHKLLPGARWLARMAVHRSGQHVLAVSYDRRTVWHDLELGQTPYKTLRYHQKAIRDVGFHQNYPLFATASDDGTANVFHAEVYDDDSKSPLLVPLKSLKSHSIQNSLGVLGLTWHPREPWLVTCGADGTAKLWTA
ncbi:hypothetical protein CANCADRAFT_128035 [Tortispora caseinolytica NRRL Y-17796]|uniref:Ribosome biogenesis protein ERB1 n=1 Tax=Tortispora caseinolytica NRRL Y-17796 TaxID=767744 RepID=A0A1E4TAJ7_9ASCO|nr:hypothetical protein CANCADRAFT_128035 [Tortispora caseinolytica NRRL Y-17796]